MAKQTTTKEAKENNEGRMQDQSIVQEMEKSYLEYAMSVIISRALPDVRDGLKPVQRRILYAMWSIGLKSGAKFRKSASVVGEVLGKYHPHGDSAVYEAMVNLAQPWGMRYPLVNGQGNFGSMDGDNAAAMRYTEAKLQKIAEEMLVDLDKDTVDFIPNYDGAHKEPVVLPAKLPNMLLMGTVGIAVGMATKIPPHNLTEVIDGTVHLIDNPDATVEDLMEFVKGPDFPTGGEIYNIEDIKHVYATGRGGMVVRAKAEILETKKDSFQIVVSEIPFQVNKATLIEKMADLVREKKIQGIKDIRDESDKDGVRIVVDLKKEAYPQKVLNQLYKMTQLQEKFHAHMLALVDGIVPRVLTLKSILEEYIKHRKVVITRRTQYELKKAEDRAHILEGLVMALEKIDDIIKTIKKSKDKDEAKTNLIKKFKLSDRQAVAILDMRLQQLANLERLKVEEELKEMQELIKALKKILSSEKEILGVVKEELAEIKEKFGDERRTKVFPNAVGEFKQEDLIPKESTIIMMTHDGYIKRLPPDTFKKQKRGGKGVIGLTSKEEDVVSQLYSTNTHTNMLFFTTRGRVFQLKAYEIPAAASRTAKGQALVNFLELAPNEKVSAVLPIEDLKEYEYLFMVTARGTVKKTEFKDFSNVRRSGLIAIKLKEEDRLEWVKPTSGKDDIVLVTQKGQAIRFQEEKVRAMGRTAGGVRGIRMKDGDSVIGMDVVADGKPLPEEQILVVMKNGYGKRTAIKEFKQQGRGGSGVKCANVTAKTGDIAEAFIVSAKLETEDIIIISHAGQVIRLPLKSVNVLGRATQGVRLMRFKKSGDEVASVTFI